MSRPPEPHTVPQLADAVADGSPIDWATVEERTTDAQARAVIRELAALAAVGSASRACHRTWGYFELRYEIGSGNFGTVYRAWDPRLEREVALKLLKAPASADDAADHALLRVTREGRMLARVRHPNVVTVYGADVFDHRAGLWMEFIIGQTLKQVLDESGLFGANEAMLIGRDVCRALAAVHAAGFLHRDIKAQNVMREAGGRIVLMDFGAGMASGHDVPLAGTPAYIAPELLAGVAPSVASDIYAVGVLLFHLVTSAFPFVANTLDELSDPQRRQRQLLRDLRPDLPDAFIRVVDRAIEIDPARRPATAGALDSLLEEAYGASMGGPSRTLAAAEPVATASAAHPAESTTERRRAAPLMVAALVAGLAIAGGAAWLWPRTRVVTAEARSSLAILPFRNLTVNAAETEYLAEGIADELSAHLSQLRDLRVVAGPSLRRYRQSGRSEQEIGSELGVAAVLDGSLRQEGDRVRIVSRLVDSRTGDQIWSEAFERDANDLLLMQSEVTRRIAVAIKGELADADSARLATAGSRDPEAFRSYLKARHYWNDRTEEAMTRSVQLFQEAIQRDPGFAAAHAGLADVYTSLGTYGFVARGEAFTQAAQAAARAIELDPELAEAHASLGYVQKNRFEWENAERSFQRAVALRPGYALAHHFYSILLTQLARFPQATVEAKLAISLDPAVLASRLQLGAVLVMSRRFDEAVAHYQEVLKIDANSIAALHGLGQAYTYLGRYEDAARAFERARTIAPAASEDQELLSSVGYLHAKAGRVDEATRIVRDLEVRSTAAGEANGSSIATIYLGLGRPDEAMRWLTQAVQARDTAVGYLKVEPLWDPLRQREPFAQLLGTLHLN